MIILAVHSSSSYLGVAVSYDGIVSTESVLPPAREHLERLALLIHDRISSVGLGLKDVDGFGVATGPGSFSGIRVGLATVKGMALALHKPVTGISSLDILAWQALQEGEAGASIIDARRKEVYVGLHRKFEGQLIRLAAPILLPAKELFSYIERLGVPPILCGDDAAIAAVEADSAAVRIIAVTPSAVPCAFLAWQRLKRGDADELQSISPLYIRPSDAEEKRLSLAVSSGNRHDTNALRGK